MIINNNDIIYENINIIYGNNKKYINISDEWIKNTVE